MSVRHKIRALALALTLGYTVVRFFVVNSLFEGYGVSPWLFLLIDAPSGVAYVLCIEYLVVSLKQSERTTWYKLATAGAMAVIAFAAPYAYIYLSGQELPMTIVLGFSVIVILLLLNAVFGFRKRVRQGKA